MWIAVEDEVLEVLTHGITALPHADAAVDEEAGKWVKLCRGEGGGEQHLLLLCNGGGSGQGHMPNETHKMPRRLVPMAMNDGVGRFFKGFSRVASPS